jgi:hypothetical protein
VTIRRRDDLGSKDVPTAIDRSAIVLHAPIVPTTTERHADAKRRRSAARS